jgi:predicted RNA-binding Zn ribbon-like protein
VEFAFVGGNLALDLVGTVAERGTTDLEQLRADADLARWFVEAGLLDEEPPVVTGDLERTIHLREALYRLVGASIAGQSLPAADLHLVNETAGALPPRVLVSSAGVVRRTGAVSNGLVAVARSFADLFGDETLLRWCAGVACTRPFVDRSRGHRRRWCGMAGCGDRAKAAAYRARRRNSAH